MANAVMQLAQIPGSGAEAGRVRTKHVLITFTAAGDTYVTGGFTLDPKSVGLLEVLGYKEISFALAAGTAQTSSWLTKFDHKTGKLQLFGSNGAAPAALAEAAASVVVGVFEIRAEIIGRV